MEEKVNAVLEQILKSVRDQSVLADRRHEAQAAFNAQVSQQLQRISKQLDLAHSASPAATAPEAAESMLAKVARECGGDISSSQEEILANSSFLGGDNVLPASDDDEKEEDEVFSTPPDAIQQQDDPATVCTPTPSRSPAPTDDEAPPAKKRSVSVIQHQQQQPQPEEAAHVDPLMGPVQDFLTLCRRKGLI